MGGRGGGRGWGLGDMEEHDLCVQQPRQLGSTSERCLGRGRKIRCHENPTEVEPKRMYGGMAAIRRANREHRTMGPA